MGWVCQRDGFSLCDPALAAQHMFFLCSLLREERDLAEASFPLENRGSLAVSDGPWG